MSETAVAFLTTLVPVVGVFLRWALRLWASVRREAIAASVESSRRGIEAMMEQAKSNVLVAARTDQLADSNQMLIGRFDAMMQKLDSLDDRLTEHEKWREQTVYRPRKDG